MTDLNALSEYYAANAGRFLDEWQAFLRIPSISADPAHAGDCRACAVWLRDHLAALPLAARLLETGGNPAVFAESAARPGAPTLLFYGHYDVQPVDPLPAWTSPPFAPELRDGRLYARGAADDKGQIFAVLKAVEALLRQGPLAVNLKILLEGEEENGSTGLTRNLEAWRDLLKADILMVADTGMAPNGAPAIMLGLRGIAGLTLEVHGPDHDLHSGVHGGLAPNPAQAAAALVRSLFDEQGRIAVAGFLDPVRQPTAHERELALHEPFDPAAYAAETGVEPLGGDRDQPPAFRTGFRPSIDINGIHGGHGGAGLKTIIPAVVTIKLSTRLVPDQDPAAALDAIVAHLHRHCPPGIRVQVAERSAAGAGFRLDPDSALVRRLTRVITRAVGRAPLLRWEGASIPIVSGLARVSGAEPALVGFGTEADHIHAPNESYSLAQFRLGFLYAGLLLQDFAWNGSHESCRAIDGVVSAL